MITEVGLVAFKRFGTLTLPFRRLTVLAGSNGTGKSSIIHALLLARKASLSESDEAIALNDSTGLQLGEAADVLNRDAEESVIEVCVGIDDGSKAVWRFSVSENRSLNLKAESYPQHVPSILVDPGRGFAHLCAERLGPRDTVTADSSDLAVLGVGHEGQFTAQVLAVLGREVVSTVRRTESSRKDETELGDLLHQCEWWMHRIVRPIELKARWFEDSLATQLMFKAPGGLSEWIRPVNMGFGLTYALPIVVAGLLAKKGGLLIVENPEAHLHPAGQSEMGRFLATVAGDSVQVVVETHSDHVLNGIRLAVASPGDPIAADDAIIHFVRAEGTEGDPVDTVTISPAGALSHWPAGFFDQTEIDLKRLSDIRRARRGN